MSENAHIDVGAFVANISEKWNSLLRRPRQAKQDAYARFMQSHRDLAGRRISEDEYAHWQESKGNPEFSTAAYSLDRAEGAAMTSHVLPALLDMQRRIVAQLVAALDTADQWNRELIRLDPGPDSALPRDIWRRLDQRFAIADFGLVVGNEKFRLERLLMESAPKTTAPQRVPRLHYEPSVASQVAS